MPLPTERETRMQRRQADGRKTNHGAIEDQEVGLIIPEIATKASPQLGGTEDGPDQDSDGREED